MFKTIRNLLAFPASFAAVRALAARQGAWVYSDCRVVETSRYTHATDTCTGRRSYFSKPSSSKTTAHTLSVIGAKRGSGEVTVTVVDARGRKVWQGEVDSVSAKGMADTLASAAMFTLPKTGREMPAYNWASPEATAKAVKADAQIEADLFARI
jgi:hypothetical protein